MSSSKVDFQGFLLGPNATRTQKDLLLKWKQQLKLQLRNPSLWKETGQIFTSFIHHHLVNPHVEGGLEHSCFLIVALFPLYVIIAWSFFVQIQHLRHHLKAHFLLFHYSIENLLTPLYGRAMSQNVR